MTDGLCLVRRWSHPGKRPGRAAQRFVEVLLDGQRVGAIFPASRDLGDPRRWHLYADPDPALRGAARLSQAVRIILRSRVAP
jgi:hypothetical protein